MLPTPLLESTNPSALMAAAEERKRLARELHDSLSYTLTISVVQLENASKLMSQEPQQAQLLIDTVRGHLTAGQDDLQQMLRSLHSHRIGADNLRVILRRLIDEFAAATGIVAHTQMQHKLPSLTDSQAIAIYRTVQEALTNCFKYAHAQNIWIRLECGDNALILNVKDDGQRFSGVRSNGYGLMGARERAAQLGGTLLLMKTPEGGVSVTLRLPSKEAVHA